MKNACFSLTLLILALWILSLAGCQPERPAAPAPQLVHEFITGAYCGPPPQETTLERYREIAEAGLDLLVPGNGALDGEANRKAMDLAGEVGLRILPVDMRIAPFSLSALPEIDESAIDAMVRDYRTHPAFAGYVVRDEPSTLMFGRLAEICRLLRKRDPDHLPLINLFPSYASSEQLGTDSFRNYLRRFIETVSPAILSFDHYPLREKGLVDTDWYGDLAVVREECRRVEIPFWIFIQAEGIRGALRVPRRPEVFWQANTALAHGARGILWFCCWTPKPDQGLPRIEGAPPPLVEDHYGAMIDRHGRRTPLYGHVREENLFLRKAGRALIGWDNERLARYADGGLQSGEGPAVHITPKPGSHLVVGTFTRDDKQRLVLANGSYEAPCEFLLGSGAEGPHAGRAVASLEAETTVTPRGLECVLGPGGCLVMDME